MAILLWIISVLFIVSVVLWLAGIIVLNDFRLPTQRIAKYKRILAIFPHADDEAVHVGGLLAKASAMSHCETRLIVLTKGERGTPDAHLETDLKQIRTAEAEHAAHVYGLDEIIQEDFGDGQLSGKPTELKVYISTILQKYRPDLVITYDLAGEYGHPDHMIVSEIVTDIIKTKYQQTALWYATLSPAALRFAQLPVQMTQDPDFMRKRSTANIRVFSGWRVVQKVRGIYAHKSQRRSMSEEVPHGIPLWFVFSLAIYDYFYIAN